MVKRYNGGVIIANQISTTNLSASGFFGLTHAANASAKGQWPGNMPQINISPAVSGLSVWDFSTNGTLNLSAPGTWTITPYVNINVNAKVWGGGGSGASSDSTGGGGGFAQGLVRLQAGVGYSLVVGAGGGLSNTCRSGGGGGGGGGYYGGGGGGGGGYYGGGGGGGDAGGGAGGGGSGYYRPTCVSGGVLTAGSGSVPGNSSCSFRISSGNGGSTAVGQAGRVVLYL